MKRIAIFGGTFNPIHTGHLVMAELSRERYHLDEVIFVPSCLPPHKTITNLATPRDRFAMAKKAVRGNPFFRISDYEIKKRGKSYTIDTVTYFRDKYKGAQLFFIIGADSYKQLSSWKDINEILKDVTFIVVNRPGYRGQKGRIRHLSVTMPGLDISSSYIRGRLKQGKSIKYLVPDSIIRYIEEQKLYR